MLNRAAHAIVRDSIQEIVNAYMFVKCQTGLPHCRHWTNARSSKTYKKDLNLHKIKIIRWYFMAIKCNYGCTVYVCINLFKVDMNIVWQ